MPESAAKKNILIHITGSIACYKAAALASMLVKAGYGVQITASESALRFIGEATFEGLTRRPVITDTFGGKPDFIPHISLAQNWADLLLVYPASANCIARMAAGIADDIWGAIFLANNFKKPVWLAPAMNTEMFSHPATQRNLKLLEEWGVKIFSPVEGVLACGTVGTGRLAEPEDMFAIIKEGL